MRVGRQKVQVCEESENNNEGNSLLVGGVCLWPCCQVRFCGGLQMNYK